MNTEPLPSLDPLLDAVTDAVEGEQLPLPQALVQMLPHGRAAGLAAQVLAYADVIELALAHYAEAQGHGGVDRSEASAAASTVQAFRRTIAAENASLVKGYTAAPLTGTPGYSIVRTVADAISTMPTPKDGNWRQAARRQVEITGSRYVQVWPNATFWEHVREQNEKKDSR